MAKGVNFTNKNDRTLGQHVETLLKYASLTGQFDVRKRYTFGHRIKIVISLRIKIAGRRLTHHSKGFLSENVILVNIGPHRRFKTSEIT